MTEEFYIDIENSSGTKQGSGPITTSSGWSYTALMDCGGSFSFAMPANDAMASEVTKKRTVRAYALLDDVWTEVGAGIIDNITKQPQADGSVVLQVAGGSEERELTYRSVGFLELENSGAAISHSTALDEIDNYAPSGWTFTADGSPGHDEIYGVFAGETVLQALVKLAEKSQSHFYRSSSKAITFASSFADSGIRAIQAHGDLTGDTCAIVGLQERIDTYDLITRIYPYGAGQGQARLTLAATNESASSGYTLDTNNNYIENDTSEATYGRIEQHVQFKDIAPVSNTDADLQAAANMLYTVALEELTRRSTEMEQETYTLSLAQCGALLRPLQTIRVVYFDNDAGMDVDADLNILESTIKVDNDGLRTTGVVVSNADRWPEGDSDIVADNMAQGSIFQAHPQMNANSYTTGYTKNVDEDYNAKFRFRFGAEVVQLQQVLFEFQLLQFESTVKSTAGETVTSSGGTAHAHTVTISAHSHTVTVAAHSHTVTVAAHSHTVTVAAHSHTVTVAAHSHTVTVAAHTHTVPNHTHYFVVNEQTGSLNTVNLGFSGASGNIGHDGTYFSGNKNVSTSSSSGEVVSENSAAAYPSSSELSVAYPSSSELSVAYPSSSEQAEAYPSSSELSVAYPSSSEQAEAYPSSSEKAVETPTSSTESTHTHTLLPVVTPSYGVVRNSVRNTSILADLEYNVNGGSWAEMSTATSLGGDWYRLDITDDVYDTDTYRPTQENNYVEVKVNTPIAERYASPSSIHVVSGEAYAVSPSWINTPQVGDRIEVTDGDSSQEAGIHTITKVEIPSSYYIYWNTDGGDIDENVLSNTYILPARMTTIDAQLAVRNIIQAIAYT